MRFRVDLWTRGIKLVKNGILSLSPPSRPTYFTLSAYQSLIKLTHMKLAALRELYEETNIFLGQDKYLPTDTTVEDRKDSHWFRQHCEKSGYVPPLARLIPFSRWVSPLQMEKVRFDTTFYLAEVDELEIVHQKLTTTELVSLDWQSPDYFMEKSETQEVKLPPPTWTKLQEIIQHTHMDDLFAYAKQKVIKVVQPCLKQSDAGLIVVFVGDEAYELETAAETALTQGKVGDRNRIYATTPFKWERNIVSDIPYTQLPTPKL